MSEKSKQYIEGYNAYMDGGSYDDCPYDGEDFSNDWYDGFDAALERQGRGP